MKCLFSVLAAVLVCGAQDRLRLPELLSFEAAPVSGPGGWQAYPASDAFSDEQIVHGGKRSVRIERKENAAGDFSGINYAIPIDFDGRIVQLRGWVRTEAVSKFAALWMREDPADPRSGALAFDSMQRLGIHGTTDWTQYTISIPIHTEGRRIYFGFLVNGTGKAWADDLELLVDGQPIASVPKAQKSPTPLDTDHEFDTGSKIALSELSREQVENLTTLGRVWGFLKYHHPRVAAGLLHWDYELFRVLPEILRAPDRASANAALSKWIQKLRPAQECRTCSALGGDLYLKPEIDWIRSESALGKGLSSELRDIYFNRPAAKQFYVSPVPGVGNPVFDNEPSYGRVSFPDGGFQLLALYRYWNIIEYWFPNRDLIGEDWGKVLAEYIPKVALAKTTDEYKRQFLTLIARVHDTHANLWSSLEVRPPVGNCRVPAVFRFVEDSAAVTGFFGADGAGRTHLQRGDVVEMIDGAAVIDLTKQWEPYYADSNRAAELRDMGRNLTAGPCGAVKLGVRRGNAPISITTARTSEAQDGAPSHDIPGDAFRLLSDDVAYVKISTLKRADVQKDIESAGRTKGLIIDIRNYPSDFPLAELGSHLVQHETAFARFTNGDLGNPGAFRFGATASLQPAKPFYSGKVVVLVDEVTQSSAEYHAMAFRAAPNTMVLGSTTAGADGNVSQIPLPGGLRTMISGIGVFYPDKRGTQRVGIVPDRVVQPTIAGIRAGRDEVLEAAVREILGPAASEAEVEEVARAGRP
jgi:C-terminal processing protease CtpA/Prc